MVESLLPFLSIAQRPEGLKAEREGPGAKTCVFFLQICFCLLAFFGRYFGRIEKCIYPTKSPHALKCDIYFAFCALVAQDLHTDMK